MPDSNFLPELTFVGIEDGQVALGWKKLTFLDKRIALYVPYKKAMISKGVCYSYSRLAVKNACTSGFPPQIKSHNI